LSKDEDGGNFDLIQNGANIEVNKANMYEFVKRYAEYRMSIHVEKCCEQLKLGVYDVLPTNSLNDLNAEDFRLLLDGIPDINIQTLMSHKFK
jgi:E3 ubiquitin-protein ligase EDD1